jgi:hypothetical protein
MHGWYSVRQSRVGGVLLYQTPDGNTVEVTSVTDDVEHHTEWDDIAYIGVVCKYLGHKTEGKLSRGYNPENMRRFQDIINKPDTEDPYRWN